MNAVRLSELWKKFISAKMENIVYLALTFVVLVLSILLLEVKKLELLPATFFSATTAAFSYLAYKFSKEKFRLDLFDKRWVVYENTLEFCSRVTQQGSLRRTDNNQAEILAALQEQTTVTVDWVGIRLAHYLATKYMICLTSSIVVTDG